MPSTFQEYLEILTDMPIKHDSQGDSDECDFSHRICDELSEGEDLVFDDPEQEPLNHGINLESPNIAESDV